MSNHVRITSTFSALAALVVALLAAGFLPVSLHAQASPNHSWQPKASDLEQKAVWRLVTGNGQSAHSFGFRPFVRPDQTNDNWLGGSGTWSTAASWSLGTVPGSGNNAVITTSGSTVTLNQSGSIAGLTIGSSDVLSFNNNTALTVTGNISNSNSTGSGGLQFNSANNLTGIEINASAVSLTGGGTITMSANADNYIYGAASGDVLTNVNNIIQGSGHIGNSSMGLDNEGTIDANQSAAPITLQTSSGTTNTGTLEATAGGNLILVNDTFTNTGGTISASGANSVVTLQDPTIDGGKLTTTSGGLIQTSGTGTVLNGVTNSGTLQLPNNTEATLQGTITNAGTIQFNSSNNYTGFAMGTAVTLTGGGTLTMSDNNENVLFASVSGGSLTNVNNTISGSGQIGLDNLAFTNDAGGVVDAVSANGNNLTIEGTAGTTNQGLMEASSGGTLDFTSTTVTNPGGTIKALTGGTVVLNDVSVTGGTLATTGTGVMEMSGDSTVLNGVTNSGTLTLPNNTEATLQGTLTNTGAIQFNSANNYTGFAVGTAVTLTGGGTLTMSDNNENVLFANAAGASLTNVNNTISGSGQIGLDNLAFTNDAGGVVDAVSAKGNTLFIEGSAGTTNLGLMEASSGGTLEISSTTVTNTNGTANGTIEALSGGEVLLSGATIAGGTLTTTGTGVVVAQSGSELNGATNTVTNAGTLEIPNDSSLLIAGTINNTGTIGSESSNNTTGIELNSATGTISGTGSITFSDNDANYIYSATGGAQLTIAQPVSGPGGNIGDGNTVITNKSTIDATASAHGNTLTIDPDGTFTNNGTLEATGGGSLALEGGTFTNTGATISAGSASTVTLEGGVTVTGGTLSGAGTIVLDNSATLNGVTNSSTVQLPNSTTSYLEGTINNTGAIQVNSINNGTVLAPSGAVTLTGGGTVTLSDNNNNYIENNGSGSLTNVNNTISGSGNIGDGGTAFTNESAGVVDATSAKGNTLTVDTPTGVNAGLIEASSGGTLLIEGTINNAGGTIEGLAGSGSSAGGTVNIDGATITGGTLNTLGTGVNASSMSFYGSAILDGVTNQGTINLPNNNIAELEGTVTNNGSINVSSTNNATQLKIDGNTTLNGTGVIYLSNNANNYILGVAGTEVLTNNSNTIEGSGNVGDAFLGIVNGGTILANQSITLFVDPNSSGLQNNGTLQANSGDLLDIITSTGAFLNFNSGTSTLTGGTYSANGGTIEWPGANIINNAADIVMTGSTAQILNSTNSANALANFATNEAGGTFQIGGGYNYTTAGTFTNNGLLIVGAGDTFKVSNGDLTNFAGSTLTGGSYLVAGTLQFGASGSGITTNDANLTLSTANWKMTNLGGGNLLTNLATNDSGANFNVENAASFTTAGAFSNSGTMDLENGGSLTVSGALTNNGTVSTNGSNQGGAANTLTVTGTLTNNTSDTVGIGENNDTSDVASVGILTNSGAVTVGTGATLNLTGSGTDTNTGTITVDNGTLSLATTADLDMEKGGKLSVTGNLTNAGTISTNESNQGGSANSITVSGTLTNDSTAALTVGANNDTSDTAALGNLTNAGTVTVGTGAKLSLTAGGADTNTGTMTVDGTLDIDKTTTLSGTGSVILANGDITGVGTSRKLTNKNTIEGSGTISNLGITNEGTISSNSGTLTILPTSAGLDNIRILSVSAGDSLIIGTSAGGALTNFSGTTLTGGTYDVTGTMQFGASGATIATNAASITLSGTGQMINFGNTNLLAGLNDNASGGVFKLTSGASLTTLGGNFLNAGTFTISTGTTFTIGGSSFNYTQTAGSTTVGGTLTSSSLGIVAVDGGTLTGAGTVGDNLVDDSTLDPGTSAAKTGRLTVADTYTQDSGGTLNIEINGATAVTKYDQLKITQGATLGGTLNIDLGSSFTPTVGQTFTILTASSVSDTFATVNGLAINSSEHFTITYDANKVVLTVVSGALTATPSVTTASAVNPVLYGGAFTIHAPVSGARYGLAINTLRIARTPVSSPIASTLPVSLAPTFRLAHVPVTGPTLAPVASPVALMPVGMGTRGFHAMDDFGSPVAAPSAVDDNAVPGSIGISALGAEAYNSMGAMNHMRFECGVDLKALMHTSRKRLVRALWASPDSPEALSIGYMNFTSAH